MDEERRRADDQKLDRLENIILDLHAKVNNGLSERSKRTEEAVNKLQGLLDEHTNKDEVLHAETSTTLNSISNSVDDLAETQKGWLRSKNRMLIAVIAGMASFIGWLIMHSKEISTLIEYLSKAS